MICALTTYKIEKAKLQAVLLYNHFVHNSSLTFGRFGCGDYVSCLNDCKDLGIVACGTNLPDNTYHHSVASRNMCRDICFVLSVRVFRFLLPGIAYTSCILSQDTPPNGCTSWGGFPDYYDHKNHYIDGAYLIH